MLCPQCQRQGEALAADDDGHPRPPTGAAMHPDYPEFAATAARMLDDELCITIGVAEDKPAAFRLDAGRREAFVAAMAAEVVRRRQGRRAA